MKRSIHALAQGLLAAACMAAIAPQIQAQTSPRLGVQDGQFVRDGKPHVIRAAEMHYARIPHEYWRARMKMARAMGLNTIQTYVFWDLHEPEPGHWDFSGDKDVAQFIRIAQEEGLDVILRPGPYVCAEWDFGGYPAWLLRTPGLRVRSMDPRFMAASAAYLKRLGQELAPLQATRGGPIVMVQVENEYGSYGNDHDYMRAVKQQVLDAGFDVPLFTADGGSRAMLEGGSVEGAIPLVNGGGSPEDVNAAFALAEKLHPGTPRMIAEYYPGWFDHWGEQHHTTRAEDHSGDIDWLLAHDISVSFYMFHGGTSFGFTPGANYSATEPYQPDTTSYDYDAPLDESGRPTPKYFALREVITKHLSPGETLPDVPKAAPTIAIPRFTLKQSVALLDALSRLSAPQQSEYPRTMEQLGQNFGLTLYRTRLPQTSASGKLTLGEPRDYVDILVNGQPRGKLDRRIPGERSLDLTAKPGDTLDLLVENEGRINYSAKMVDERKGIISGVHLGKRELSGWQQWTLPLDDLSRLQFSKAQATQAPAFWRGEFTLDKTGDTFLDVSGWGKGHVYVNGHHLGRFWHIGPQQSLYLPGVWLKRGKNEIIVLDVEPAANARHDVQGLQHPLYETKKS
ncbi:glycoside hydrolase family 35 protein [Solilutibacter silvestris]|uniref:Beta-galactosidase n=1 Tax=Solilutibacter silvestris TaxID=1645665 RepID=A0A2K1Q0J1_9GAMM|nr:beta-galactosidase [Lysobacter silvestris]PNS08544.1 Glycosyl hydrolases family 35 [Lysobacter silvestris]